MDDKNARERRIQERAFEIWVKEGRPAGHQQEHWDRATQETDKEHDEAMRLRNVSKSVS